MTKTGDKLSANVQGILLMVGATMLLTSMSTIVRTQSGDLHPFEIAFLRNVIGVTMLLPLLIRYGIEPLRTRRIGLMALRGAFNAAAMILYFVALGLMPLSELAALSFTTPLFVAILAVPILKERLGPRRIMSLIIGFSGALIILRPGIEVIDASALVALGSAASWGAAVLVIKFLSRTDSPVTITIYGLAFLTLFTFPPALFVWQWPTWEQMGWMAVIAALGTVGQIMFAQSMKRADATLVMPFDFTKLLWASLLGFVVFSEVPTVWTIVGGTVIFASSTYFTYRERHTAQPTPPAESEPSPAPLRFPH